MKSNRPEAHAFLDQVRLKRGNESLVQSFRNTLKANKRQAIDYLNDKNIRFPSVYVLREVISKEKLTNELANRSRLALEFINNEHGHIHGWVQTLHPPLLWMIQSGGQEYVDPPYLKKMDGAAGLLTVVYGDRSVLPAFASMLFFRCRNHLPYHDLVWAFLEAREPLSLSLIADRLRSDDHKESDCARRMLSFIPGIDRKTDNKGDEQYRRFCKWVENNGHFLYYKGETFDTTHHPNPYVTVRQAKYLGVFVSNYDGKPYAALSNKESRLWKQLSRLNAEEQEILADYSAKLRGKDQQLWKKWLSQSMRKQMQEARGGWQYD